MQTQTRTVTPAEACTTLSSVFQHPLLEDGASPANAAERRLQQQLAHQATQACSSCPLLHRCLYDAVVNHDVAGHVAATTPSQRQQIRNRLGWHVRPEDLDRFAGAATPNRQIDPNEVIRLRTAHPHESLDGLAERLGCSLSTVKRHLRKARNGEPSPAAPAPVRPSMELVLQATREVLRRQGHVRRAA